MLKGSFSKPVKTVMDMLNMCRTALWIDPSVAMGALAMAQ